MIKIVLPPDLEQAVTHQAQQQGTSPELYLLNDLRQRYLAEEPPASPPQAGQTMAEYLGNLVGCIDSREVFPEGSHMSEDSGRKFADLMVEKRRQGKL
jgi:hypothetical protein